MAHSFSRVDNRPIVPKEPLIRRVAEAWDCSRTAYEPPPPALRRCIFGAPPTTSDPWAFSLEGPSFGTSRSLDCLRSKASCIFALRSSLAWLSVMAPTLPPAWLHVEAVIRPDPGPIFGNRLTATPASCLIPPG